jgi:IS30 family transposase
MPAYSHLLDEERDQIAVMRAAGHSICAIAGALHRAKSTVSRELRRNVLPSGRYSPLHATGAYQLRRRHEAILEKVPTLRTFVRDRHGGMAQCGIRCVLHTAKNSDHSAGEQPE